MNASITSELSPGANVTTDDEWNAWILNDFHTEYHPSCSCSMLPQNQGGVVDAHLKVYGVNNVRVVDSSVFPIEWSAHMMAPTYGLAEKAAEIILAQYSGSSGSGSSTGGASPTPTTTASHSGALLHASFPSYWISTLAISFLSAVALL
jgi:choline dehydrogenase-like flavoprotein